ncbi:MAG TPA: hypothetical protein VFP68_22980, partial [Burkholderiaceae bacterium]|nr:hypothetical protein [Burkholderiaceae bacterium]
SMHGEHIRSVSDAALYIDDSIDVERVRPYVHVVGGGETGDVQLTEFGRKELEARDQRERTKRARHHFIHHPTPPTLNRFEPEFKGLRIEDGESNQAPTTP